jgi:selenium-binding protein 1
MYPKAGRAHLCNRKGVRFSSAIDPPESADPAELPRALAPFAVVPPLVTDIDLAVDDHMLYVSCWGTGELKQYDVSEPTALREVGSVHLGGIVRRAASG